MPFLRLLSNCDPTVALKGEVVRLMSELAGCVLPEVGALGTLGLGEMSALYLS